MPIEISARKNHHFCIDISEENQDSDDVALLLPGVKYRLGNPIFYFIKRLLLDHGYRVAGANYAYDKIENFRDFGFEEVMNILSDDAATIGEATAQLPPHRKLLVVGKSLGTVLMGNMLKKGFISKARLAWITPSSKVPQVVTGMLENASKSFVCIGTADKGYTPANFEQIKNAGATVSLLDNLAHVLECENDVPQSILGHHKLVTYLQNWL